ncbi:hypothetical protein [Nostoc sp. 'Peltigera membranacea cyanobiont' 232]|uniref:hypothetical protein n=1 Tax=Nostoc sp. 'Peltigera membranacea cyanobiont' 232 TaxID=2014531 RepID=UPI001671BD41|nr:hypothetical protein [Nostoc sp. 'Peltigera membranacea cyanobiont' 232]
MNFSLISKVYKIIELAELIYCPKSSDILFGRVNIPETFLDKLSNYLEDFEMTGRTSVRVLHKYVDDFSSEEKGQVIALTALSAAMRYILKAESYDRRGAKGKLYCIIAGSAVSGLVNMYPVNTHQT